jgi:hypothetical protein
MGCAKTCWQYKKLIIIACSGNLPGIRYGWLTFCNSVHPHILLRKVHSEVIFDSTIFYGKFLCVELPVVNLTKQESPRT